MSQNEGEKKTLEVDLKNMFTSCGLTLSSKASCLEKFPK